MYHKSQFGRKHMATALLARVSNLSILYIWKQGHLEFTVLQSSRLVKFEGSFAGVCPIESVPIYIG